MSKITKKEAKTKRYMEKIRGEMIPLFSVQGKSGNEDDMIRYITSELDKINDVSYQVKDRNIYAIKGNSDIYPCVAAHTDTVHTFVEDYKVMYLDDTLFAINSKTFMREGVGGDDRAGIFANLKLLSDKDNLKAVFFAEEEIGCVGSSRADMSFFKDVSLVLQTDRKGHKEFVNNICSTKLQSKEFMSTVEPILTRHGFKAGHGGLTDVFQLSRNTIGVGVSVANMSSGYYNPHTSNEYQSVSKLIETINLMSDIIDELGFEKVWTHKYEAYVPKNNFGGGYKRYGWYNNGYGSLRSGAPKTKKHSSSNTKVSSKHQEQLEIPITHYKGFDSYEEFYANEYGIDIYEAYDIVDDTPYVDVYEPTDEEDFSRVKVLSKSPFCKGECEHYMFRDSDNETVRWCNGCSEIIEEPTQHFTKY